MPPYLAKALKILAWLVREILSVWLWTLIIIRTFAYDIDDDIIRSLPWVAPVFRFRFFIIIAVVAVLWLVLNRKGFRNTILFIAFYPVVLVWRVTKLLWRNWAIVLIFLPVTVTFISTIKRRFIVATVAILSAFTIVVASQRYLIGTAMLLLFAYLISHYVDRFRFAYGGSEILREIAGRLDSNQRKHLDAFRNKEMREVALLEPKSEEFRKKHTEHLQTLFIQNLMYTALQKKLDRATKISDLSFLAMFVYTFFLTTVVFGFEFFGLHKIQPASFSGAGRDSLLAYVLFSFSVLVRSGFASVAPANDYARQLIIAEVITGFVLLIILFWVLFTSSRQRHHDTMKHIISEVSKLGPAVANFISEEFRLTLLEAEAQLINENPEFRSTIRQLGGEVHFPADINVNDR